MKHRYDIVLIPGIMRNREEFYELPETSDASEYVVIQDHNCITQNRNIVEEEWEKDVGLGQACH